MISSWTRSFFETRVRIQAAKEAAQKFPDSQAAVLARVVEAGEGEAELAEKWPSAEAELFLLAEEVRKEKVRSQSHTPSGLWSCGRPGGQDCSPFSADCHSGSESDADLPVDQ
jgi:hypothetical protein